MTAASVGLLVEPLGDSKYLPVVLGFALGVAFLLFAQRRLAHRPEAQTATAVHARRSLLVFAVLFVHSLPEGFALGSSWAANAAGIGVFVFIAISIQNVPEGTATAIPMAQAGYSERRQFWAAVGTSVPQPFGAVIAFVMVEEIKALLPWSLGFAAGAMLALVAFDLLPEALADPLRRTSALGAAAAALIGMALLGAALSAFA